MAVPTFALLLIVIGYQNIATIPSLRSVASSPRLAPWATLHAGTRAGAHLPVVADRKSGAVLLIDVPNDGAYASFAFDLEDPQGKKFWSQTVSAPSETGGASRHALSSDSRNGLAARLVYAYYLGHHPSGQPDPGGPADS